MDKFLLISSVIIFVETRIKGKIDYSELATATGFSLPYVRELFACNMNKSQYRYKLERKIANAAFECCYTDKSLQKSVWSTALAPPMHSPARLKEPLV
jgi:hypothetical protein